ncbi:hypothetical protein SAMN05428978_10711 [Nitrosomonas sp. Nm34]|nr:hypothetical protein SAMN05428978_10711 [Nitrosomonas sp. Nm34]
MGIMGSIRFCDSLSYWVQPPDAENRTSGGVGEVTDTIRYPDPIQLYILPPKLPGKTCGFLESTSSNLRWMQ